MTTDATALSESPIPNFKAEMRAYRARAERARRAQALTQLRPPGLRPYSGWEHFLTLLSPQCCGLCDTPLGAVSVHLCPTCEALALARGTHREFGQVWSVFQHDELSRRAVSRLKYGGERWRGHQLAQHLALSWLAEMPDAIDADDLLIGVPLSANRIRTRGFNQAEVLIRGIQARVRLQSCSDTLFRRKGPSRDQKTLSREERLQNRGRFHARPKHQGRRVWLVDDVLTTGATLDDAAQTLEDAGLKPVGALTLTWTR